MTCNIIKKTLLVSGLSALSGAAYAQDGWTFADEVLKVKVQKPEVSYILSRPDIAPAYDFELQESFLPRIEASVQEKPF